MQRDNLRTRVEMCTRENESIGESESTRGNKRSNMPFFQFSD